MKYKSLLTAVLVVFFLVSGVFAGTIDWLSVNFGGDNGYGDGWFVALYEDVNKDGWTATVINPDGTTDSDDVFTGIYTSLFVIPSVVEQWASSFSSPGGSLALGDNLVAVLFNATDIASSTLFQYTSEFTTFNGGTGPGGSYVLPVTDVDDTFTTTAMSGWQAIPEPATALLFFLGSMGAWVIRRNKMR